MFNSCYFNVDKNLKRGDFIGKYTTPEELKEYYCTTDIAVKPLSLLNLIKQRSWTQVLCFTNSSIAAHRFNIFQIVLKLDDTIISIKVFK